MLVTSVALTLALLGCTKNPVKIPESQQDNERIEKYEEYYKRAKENAFRTLQYNESTENYYRTKGCIKEKCEFIKNYNKNNELEMKGYFNEIGFATVKAPKGKEIGYVCLLNSVKDETVIDFAEPNYLVRILPIIGVEQK